MKNIKLFLENELVNFLATPVGIIFSHIFFAIALLIMDNPYWKEITLSLTVLNLAPGNRLKILTFINIVLYFVIDLPFVSTMPSYKNMFPVITMSTNSLSTENIILKMVILLVFWLLIKFVTYFRNKQIFETISFPFLLISILSFMGYFIVKTYDHSYYYIFISCFFILLSRALWSLSYAFEDYKYLSNKNTLYILGTSFTFWTLGMIRFTPVPKGLPHIEYIITSDNKKLAPIRLSGLKLMVWSLVLKYLAQLINIIFFKDHGDFFGFSISGYNISNFQDIPLNQYIAEKHPIYEVWAVAGLNTLKVLMNEIAAQSGMIVATVRMAGFSVFRQTYKPYLAKDMNDWFRRLYHFYNEVLLKFFFFPIIRFFTKLKLPKQLNIFLSTFLTICFGGLIIFTSHNPRFFFDQKFNIIAEILIGRLPYFFTIGFFSGLSAVFYKHKLLKTDKWYIHIVRITIIFFIYSFAFASQNRYYMGDVNEKINFILMFFKFWS